MQLMFGSGVLWGVSTTVPNPTPIRFGVLQEVSVDISYTTKALIGQNQFPVDIARGGGKVTGKAKFARFNGLTVNQLFFGLSASAGQLLTALNEAHAVPATPFQVTIAPPSSGTFLQDLGVVNATTGIPLTLVASAPSTGQYSVAGPVYTFAAADTGINMLFSYSYTTSSGGNSLTMSNQLLGFTPTFKMILSAPFRSKQMTLVLNQCVASKLTMATKLEDYMIPEFDFEAFTDAAENLGVLSMAE